MTFQADESGSLPAPRRARSRCRLLGLAIALVLPCLTASAAEPLRRLTLDGRAKQLPVFLRGGTQLVYTEELKFNQLALMRLTLGDDATAKANGGTPTPEPLHPAATTSEFAASWSADEQVWAYIRNDGNLHVRLVIEDLRAGTKTEHDPGGGFAGVQSLSVAPDGSSLFFAFPERGFAQQIFSLSTDGKRKAPVVTSDGFDTCPQVSPDGKRLAFASTRDGDFEIYVASIDGGSVRRVTDRPGLDSHPSWSPDGRRLAYASLRDGNVDVVTVSLGDGRETRLTDHPERDDYPVWHPDGRHIVTVSERRGRQDLYLWPVEPAQR